LESVRARQAVAQGQLERQKKQKAEADAARAKLRAEAAAEEYGPLTAAKDIGLSAIKGTVDLAESVTGLADIISFGTVGKALAKTGYYDPESAKKFYAGLQSATSRDQQQNVQEAQGFVNSLKAIAVNPAALMDSVVSSLPSMVAAGTGGGMLVKQLMTKAAAEAAALKLTGEAAAKFVADKVKSQTLKIVAATSAGEGALTAGSTAEAGRQAGKDWDTYVLPALAAGLGDVAINMVGGKVAKKLGIGDVQTSMATRMAGLKDVGMGTGTPAVQVFKELAKEGFLEEMPQSYQEQIFRNLATGKPWDEGVDEAAAQGLVAGVAMAGGHQASSRVLKATSSLTGAAKAKLGEVKADTQEGFRESMSKVLGIAKANELLGPREGAYERPGYEGLAKDYAQFRRVPFASTSGTLSVPPVEKTAAEPELGNLENVGMREAEEPGLSSLEGVQAGKEPPFATGEAAPTAEDTEAKVNAIAERLRSRGIPRENALRIAQKQVAEEQAKGAKDVAGTEPPPSGESVSVAGEPGTESAAGLETPARDGVVSAATDAGLAADGKGPEPAALTETKAEEGTPSGTETVEAKQAEAQEQEAPAAPVETPKAEKPKRQRKPKAEAPAAPVEDIAIEPEVSPPSKGVVNAFEAAKRRIPIGPSIGEQIAEEEAKEKASRKKVKDFEAEEKKRKAEEDRIAKEEKATAEEITAAETAERDAAAKVRAGAVDVLGMEPQITGALQEIVNSPRFAPGIRKDARRHLDTLTESATSPKADAHEAGLEMAFNFVTEQASKPRFMRQGKKPLPSIGRDKVSSIIDAIKARWNNAPEVVVVDNINDSAVPTELQEADREAVARGATGAPNAVFHKGKVYIFADQMTSTKDVVEALLHETLGHYGLRGVFGKGLKPILEQVARDFPKEMQALKEKYGLDFSNPKDVAEAAEEVLANLAATKPTAGIVQRAIAAVRRGLRSIGIDLKLSNNDLIANYILPARNFVEGERVNRATSGETRFSRTDQRTQQEMDADSAKAWGKVDASQRGQERAAALSRLMALHDPRVIWARLKGVWDKLDEPARKAIALTFDRNGIASTVGEQIPALKDITDRLQRMDGMAASIRGEAAKQAGMVVNFARKDREAMKVLDRLIPASTLNRYDPANPPASGVRDTATDEAYASLKPAGQRVYREVRDYFADMHNAARDIMESSVDALDLPADAKQKLMASVRLAFEEGKISPYFPLMRYGDYIFRIKQRGVDGYESYRFETKAERDFAAKAYAKEQGAALEDLDVELAEDDGGKDLRTEVEGRSKLLKEMYEAIDSMDTTDSNAKAKLKDNMYQVYLDLMPEESVRKQFIHREEVVGFSTDTLRMINTQGIKIASALSKLQYGNELRNLSEQARRQLKGKEQYKAFVGAMDAIVDEALNPQPLGPVAGFFDPVTKQWTKFTFYHNLTSLSSALMQPADIFLTGTPVLVGNHGPKALVELAKMAQVTKQYGVWETLPDGTERFRAPSIAYAKGLPEIELKAIADMVGEYGLSTDTLANEIFDAATKPIDKADSKAVELAKDAGKLLVLGGLMHHAERLSREVLGAASFRLYYAEMEQASPGNPANYANAVRAAVAEVNEALGDYSPGNRPQIMRGPIGKLTSTYKFFPLTRIKLLGGNFFRMIPFLNKEGKIAAATKFFGILGTHSILTGVVGLPMYGIIQALWGQWQRDDDAPQTMKDLDHDTWWRTDFLRNELGDGEVAKLLGEIAKGGVANYATGMAISERLGLNDMLFRTPDPAKNLSEAATNYVVAIFGVQLNLIKEAQSSIDYYSQGEYQKAFEALPFTPKGVATLSATERVLNEGIETKQGIPILDKGEATTKELIGQALGFQSARVAEARRIAHATDVIERGISTEKQAVVGKAATMFLKAINPNRSPEQRQRFLNMYLETVQKVPKFNVKYPEHGIDGKEIDAKIDAELEKIASSKMFGGVKINDNNLRLFFQAAMASREALNNPK
jgi:hypothetical protein